MDGSGGAPARDARRRGRLPRFAAAGASGVLVNLGLLHLSQPTGLLEIWRPRVQVAGRQGRRRRVG